MIRNQRYSQRKLQLAKRFRLQQTPAEKAFWDLVRTNRFKGWHFRRQQVIDGFIADFYCDKLKLVVEIDGGIHESQKDCDAERDRIIRTHGINILRLSNDVVVNNRSYVIKQLESFA
ncbi:MAG TPA: DUF559 domain-containing protein [Candidatus Edwardsbacteria bacterium]|nr:DUF559 domain-containing protein [Candidatus Edwardsbacteria bacterium]